MKLFSRFPHIVPFVASALLASLFLTSASAAPVRISGQVLDKTVDRPLGGATVQLVRPDGTDDGGKVLATTRSGANGRFDFGARDLAADDLLVGRVKYQNYSYEKAVFDGAGRLAAAGAPNSEIDPANATIEVYQSTTQTPELSFLVHHLAIKNTPKGLQCIERIVVQNPSNKTFLGIGPRQSSIVMELPEGAHDVQLDPKVSGAQLFKTDNGYAISKPITPATYSNFVGRNAVIVNYMVDWPGVLPWKRQVNLSRRVQYPTGFFFVARETEDQDLQVKSPLLGADQVAPLPIDGQEQQRIINAVGEPSGPMMGGGDTAPAIKPGDTLQVEVTRPVPGMFWGFLALFGCMLLFVPLALLRGPRRTAESRAIGVKTGEPSYEPSVIAASSAQAAPPSPQTRQLAAEIAQLDEAWEAGRLEEGEYNSLRAGKKSDLIALLLARQS